MSTLSDRLSAQPGEIIDRSSKLRFTWNGKGVTGFAGDTIASALMANNVQVVSRSMKYHRPRGYMTADYWDPNGSVQLASEPNVRSGHRQLQEGMKVSAQNVWPSLDRDVRAVNGVLGRFLTAGFYYKTFMHPRSLWPTYEKVLATFAPGGKVDLDAPSGYFDKRYAHPDVVVAGGGPSGLAAAIDAARAGAKVMLVEHTHHLGGHLLWGSDGDRAVLAQLLTELAEADVEVLVDSTVTGRYEDNWIGISQRSHPGVEERLIKARAKMLVVAGGLIERPYVFEGNDLPGVMMSSAVRRSMAMYAVRPGSRAVVLSANAEGDAAVEALTAAGVEVAAVVDPRNGQDLVRAKGSRRVESVELADGRSVEADLLVIAAGWTSPTSLINMAGDRPSFDDSCGRFFPTDPPETVLVTGGMAGDGTTEEIVEHGRATGDLAARRASTVAHRLQAATTRAQSVDEIEPVWAADSRIALGRWSHPGLYRASTHGIVDYSEDVSSKDLVAAAKEGYDSVELLKRYTTATMGPSQGKLSTVNTVAILGEARGETIAEVGTTVWRPPFAPISLGALGGRKFEPIRVSAMHRWHEANGATPIIAGQWIRPEHYGDPAAEVRKTRSGVGLIDVSPLGKLDLQGADVPKLLNHLYTNTWNKLPIGGVRYGIMCAEDGIVLDDGVTGRLGENHYLMTTTSSGAATVWEWAENWLQTEHPDWDVSVTPVTTAYASMNLAGPKSREVLSSLVDDIDLDPEDFRYMQLRTGRIAGVDNCIMWRIGFTGELSFELHVPAGYGEAVWRSVMEAGAEFGITPFGLEGQRIMRLEKGHFIVGQDTDGLSLAPATGLDALIKLDKPDFAGKPELSWALENYEGPLVVAVQPVDPNVVPGEASQIIDPIDKRILGRITSARYSPTLERSVCLAQVEPQFATAGSRLTIKMIDGSLQEAVVQEHHAHFDPEGERLRG